MSTLAVVNRMLPAVWRRDPGSQLRRLLFETDGQDLIEYALVTTFIGFAGMAGWTLMQTVLGDAYDGFVDAVWDNWEPADPVGGTL